MKILYLITRAELGGAQTHVVDLLRGLRDKFDVEVGVGETGYLTDAAEELGVRWHVVPGLIQPMRPVQDMRALWNCVRLIRAVQPDIVHTHTSKAGFIGRMAARIAGVPSMFTAHTWCFAEGTSWMWKTIGIPLERLAARSCAQVLTVSGSNGDLALRNRIGTMEKFATVHNGIGDCPHRAKHWDTDEPRIVMVARFSTQKAQAQLVEAVSGIETPFQLWFVGNGPTRAAVEQKVNEFCLEDRVRFLGERRDVPEILASSDIFALATNWEGFPISILEAMRAGLPVVASDVNGVGEAVADGETGYLVGAGDIAVFRSRLERLIHNATLRREMGRAGRRRFEAEFTVDVMLRKVAGAYRAIVERGEEKALATAASRPTTML